MSYETRNVWQAVSATRPRARARVDRRSDRRVQRRAATAASASARARIRIPVAPDFPIAYTKGPLHRRGRWSSKSTRTCATSCASPSAPISICAIARRRPRRNATSRARFTEGQGDVIGRRDLERRHAKCCSRCAAPSTRVSTLDDEDQPKWNIWEYAIATDTLRRLIVSDLTAQQGHDLSPHYLPDGRIIFVSTRQQTAKAILINDGKPQYDARDEDREEPAFVLHVMRDDGRDEFKQVSFNQSSDYEPTVLDNGKVLFSRWDHAGNVNGIHLYQMNPDGTELELLYGAESHLTGTNNGAVQFVSAREMLDGRIMAIVRPFDHPELGGAITIIDTQTYVENTQPVASSRRHDGSGADGRDAEPSAHATSRRRRAAASARRSRCGTARAAC